MQVDLQKTFPDIPCVSQMLGGPSLRLGDTKECLNIPSSTGWRWNDTGRLVTWECPLRADSTPWKSFDSFRPLIFILSFLYLANEFKDIFLIFDQSSSYKLCIMWIPEISWILTFHWAFQKNFTKFSNFVPTIVHKEVVDLVEIVRLLDEPDNLLLFCDSIISFNFWILLLWWSAWNSYFRISAWQSARICSFCRSKRILIWLLSESRRGFSWTFQITDPNSSDISLRAPWIFSLLNSGE